MGYTNTGNTSITITLNKPAITGIDILTIAWYGEDLPFNSFYNFYAFITALQLADLKGNGYGDYGTGFTNTTFKTLVHNSDDIVLSIADGAESSYMPNIRAICNPLLYGYDIPLMPPVPLNYRIAMTEYLTTAEAVTTVNFGTSSVTVDDFVNGLEHRFKHATETITITPTIPANVQKNLFMNTNIYEGGFRFDLINNSGIVYDVDEVNNSSKCYGARYTDSVVLFRLRIERTGLGGNTYTDRPAKFARIPFLPSYTAPASISQQADYLYHDEEKDFNFVLDLKRYGLNGDRYIDGFFYVPADGISWEQMKTWYNTSPEKVPIFAAGRKVSSTAKLYRAGKVLSVAKTSADSITLKVKAPAGSYKLQSAGYRSSATGETQKGKVLKSRTNDILRENKAVTL